MIRVMNDSGRPAVVTTQVNGDTLAAITRTLPDGTGMLIPYQEGLEIFLEGETRKPREAVA